MLKVDNLVALLSQRTNATILRLGHPARVNKQVQRFTLDEILASSSSVAEVLKEVKKELLETRDYVRRAALRDEIKQRERDATREVITNSRIVLATLAGAAELKKLLPSHNQRVFTHLIVDEAAQAMESAVLVPLAFVKATEGVLVLAGDHKQVSS
jgi:superfamily I DNA and/or RNA helicase